MGALAEMKLAGQQRQTGRRVTKNTGALEEMKLAGQQRQTGNRTTKNAGALEEMKLAGQRQRAADMEILQSLSPAVKAAGPTIDFARASRQMLAGLPGKALPSAQYRPDRAAEQAAKGVVISSAHAPAQTVKTTDGSSRNMNTAAAGAGQRLGNVVSGLLNQYAGGMAGAAGAILSAGAEHTLDRPVASGNSKFKFSSGKNTETSAGNAQRRRITPAITQAGRDVKAEWGEAANRLAEKLEETGAGNIEEAKQGLGSVGRFAVDVGVGAGQMAADLALGAASGGGMLLPMAVRSFGSGATQARRAGASADRQFAYGIANAAVEVLTEKMFSGNRLMQNSMGQGIADGIAERLIKRLTKTAQGRTIARIASGFLEEGTEEVVAAYLEPVIQGIYDNGEAFNRAYNTGSGFLDLTADAVYQGLVGGTIGLIGAAANTPGLYAQSVSELGQEARSRQQTSEQPTGTGEREQTAPETGSDTPAPVPPDAFQTALDRVRATGQATGSMVESMIRDRSALERAGIDPNGKTNSQLRAQVQSRLQEMAGNPNLSPVPQQTARSGQADRSVRPAQEQTPQSIDPRAYTERIAQGDIGNPAFVRSGEVFDRYGREAFQPETRTGQELEDYYNDFVTAYHAGLSGRELGQAEITRTLTDTQRTAAWEAGRQDRTESAERNRRISGNARTAGSQSGLVMDEYVSSRTDPEIRTRIDAVSRQLGVRTAFAESIRNGTAVGSITGYDMLIQQNGVDPVLQIAGHEWTHRLQELAPDAYQEFRDAIAQEEQQRAMVILDERRAMGENLTYDRAMDEAAADRAGEMLQDGRILDEFIESHRDNRNLLQKMLDAVRGLLRRLNGVERRPVQEAESKLRAALDAAATRAGVLQIQTQQTQDGESRSGSETRYALRDKRVPNYEELISKPDIPVIDIRDHAQGTYSEQRRAIRNGDIAQSLYERPILNRDTGEQIFITPATLTHSFSNRGAEQMAMVRHLREIVENAVLTHVERSRKAPNDHTTGVYKLFGAAYTENGIQPVKLTVKEYHVDNQMLPQNVRLYFEQSAEESAYARLYDSRILVAEKIEKESASSSAASTAHKKQAMDNYPSALSIISVQDLINLVNKENQKYLPPKPGESETEVAPQPLSESAGYAENTESARQVSESEEAESGPDESPDTRYATEHAEYIREIAELRRENEELRQRAERWRNQTRRTEEITLRQDDIDKVARKVIRELGSEVRTGDISRELKAIGEDFMHEKIGFAEAKERLIDVSRTIVENASVLINGEEIRIYQDTLKPALKQKMSISRQDASDIADFNDWRRRSGLNVSIDGGNTPVDTIYQSLTESFPEFFPDDIYAVSDQLLHMAEVMDTFREVYENPYSHDMAAAIEYGANELLELLLSDEVRQSPPTFADRQAAKLDREIARQRQIRGELRKSKNERIEQEQVETRKRAQKVREVRREKNAIIEQEREKAREKVRELREKKNAAIKREAEDALLAGMMSQGRKDARQLRKAREKAQEKLEKARQKIEEIKKDREKRLQELRERNRAKTREGRERQAARQLRNRIYRHTGELSKKLLRPTDSRHIPEELRGPVAAMLEAVNLESNYTLDSSTLHRTKSGALTGRHIAATESGKQGLEGILTRRTAAFHALKQSYEAILREGNHNMVIDPALVGNSEFAGLFDEVLSMKDTRIADMKNDQLQKVWDVIKAVEHSVTTANRVLSDTKFQRTSEWAEQFRRDTATRRDKRALARNSRVALDLSDPYTYFSSYGEAGRAIYRMLRNAEDLARVRKDEVVRRTREISGDRKTIRENQTTRTEFTTKRGEHLTLTTAQIMGLYNLSHRKQAIGHLMEGGIVQPPIRAVIGGGEQIERGTRPVFLDAEELKAITDTLTEDQKETARKFQRLTGFLAEYGNEASMAVYGYRKFTEPDYWMIHSAREGVYSNVEQAPDVPRSIRNTGLAKATVPHARNAIDVVSIYDDFAAHAADMIEYSVWLTAMEDAERLFNYRYRDENGRVTNSFKGELERVGGAGSQEYWNKLMGDIQNGIDRRGTGIDQMIDRITGNVKGAAVGANIRVVLQQGTAWFRALCVMSPKDLARGAVSGATESRESGWEKAKQYAPIARIKDVGGFDQGGSRNIAREMYDDGTVLDKISELSTAAAAAADAFTWGQLWNASEWAAKRQNPNLTPGSARFYEKTAEIFTDVIDQTQVVDGILQRAQIMRSGNGLTKQATAFMGEPLKSLNLLIRGWDGIRYESDPAKRREAIQHMGRVIGSLLITDVVNALAQSVADAWRDDDKDKKYMERFWSAFHGLTGDEESMTDYLTSVGLNSNVSDNMNPLGRIPYVKDGLSIVRGFSVQRMDASAFGDLFDAAATFAESAGGSGTRTSAYAIKQLIATAAKISGIPLTNLTRDIWDVVRSIAVETGNIPMQYEMEQAIYNLSHTRNLGRYYDIMYRALEQEDYDSYRHIRTDILNQGMTTAQGTRVGGQTIENAMKNRFYTAKEKNSGYELPEQARNIIRVRETRSGSGGAKEETFDVNDLSAEEYQAYDNQRISLYEDMTREIQSGQAWGNMDSDARSRALELADTLAHSLALENQSHGQYERSDTWMYWAVNGGDYGVTEYEAVLFQTAWHMAKEDRDANGKVIENSRKKNTLALADTWIPGLSKEKRAYLKSLHWGVDDRENRTLSHAVKEDLKQRREARFQ